MFSACDLELIAANALGIEAASFFREDEGEAEKDIAESPTAIAGTPLLAISYQQLAVRVLSS